MNIGVSVYSYNRYLREGTMTLADAVASAAEIGFTSFEMLPDLRGGAGHPGRLPRAEDHARGRRTGHLVLHAEQ